MVKVTHPDLIQGSRAETFRRRFSAEVRALAAVSHPNLVRIHRAGITSSGLPAIVMDFVEGPTLEQCLSGEQLMSALDIVGLLGKLGSALRSMHEKGIVHRDISPQNVILQRADDGSPVPILLDFGVAAFLSEEDSQTIVGTPRYMAPERQFSAATEMSDMYSIGAIGWWAFSGIPYRPGARLDSILETRRRDLISREVVAPMLQALVDLDPRRRLSAAQVERRAVATLEGPEGFRPCVRPRVAIIDANPVTATAARSMCRAVGADVVRFETSNAFFGRRCRRTFDLVVLVGEYVDNPVVLRGLGVDVVQVVFGPDAAPRDTLAHTLRLPAEQSVLLDRIAALSVRPAGWIRQVDSWLEAWRCVLDSSMEGCNHCEGMTGQLSALDDIAGSKEPPRLSRLLAALHEQHEQHDQDDQRAAQGLFDELHRACGSAIRDRVKELANDDH